MNHSNRHTFNFILPLVLGPVIFILLLLFHPETGINHTAWAVLAVASWMVIWWVTEAVPIAITALIPLILFPLLGVMSINESTAPYSNKIIFLFMGGFMIALGMEKRNLHKRIALFIISKTGTHPNGIILGFMLSTALLSMWISNTATAVMMLPVAMSVISLMEGTPDKAGLKLFSMSLLLGIAYAANIGGTATIIGTPPNIVLVGYMEDFYGYELDFSRWLLIGLPASITLLLITYLVLTRFLFRNKMTEMLGSKKLIRDKIADLGSVSSAEKKVAIIFIITALSWILRRSINEWFGLNLNDTIIAMIGGMAMFVVPVDFKKKEFIISWKSTKDLPWGILILFGGGMCLAKGLETVGIVEHIGSWVASHNSSPNVFHLFILISITLFLTELMSNVALITVFLPVVIAISNGLDVNPLFLAIPVTLASSCAFMMPVSTPPNAVVFSSGLIRMKDMMKAGLVLNLIAILVLLSVGLTLVVWVYGS